MTPPERGKRGSELACPNPFCDGYGNIDVSPSVNGRAWFPSACEVGPHPPMPKDFVWPKKRPEVSHA